MKEQIIYKKEIEKVDKTQAVKLKNTYFDESKPKIGTFFILPDTVTDITGKIFKIYHRGALDFHVDIPIGENEIGIEVNGFFYYCFASHPMTITYRTMVERVKHKCLTVNVEKEFKKGQRYHQKLSELKKEAKETLIIAQSI